MKRIWTYGLLMAGVLAAALAANQMASNPADGIFYRVSGGKNEMYLLGSIHVGSRDMYPMGNSIRQALERADVLVFECDTTSQEAASTVQMMYSETKLSDAVTRECYENVKLAAECLGYDVQALERMKPWAVTSNFTVAAAARGMEAGSSKQASALGVEDMVRKQGKNKKVSYLETAVDQLGRLDAFSSELQEYLLNSACLAVTSPETASETDEELSQWPEWWREGNTQAFIESYRRSMEREVPEAFAQEYHQSLVTERNRSMADSLVRMLEDDSGDTYLATVGLMHLVLPEDSIITELKNRGYTVEQLVNK